jgi:hypothetical protein
MALLPGVPPLLFPPVAQAPFVLLTADTVAGFAGFGVQQWGIFLGGSPVVTADSVVSFEYKAEWTISDYPVEQGAFQSYDKVYVPFDVRITFTAGGSLSNRQSLLDSIAAIAGDLNLYDAVTPEATYSSVNVTHYDYKRTATNGLGLMQVTVWCEQVVTTTTNGGLSSTAAASGADQVNDGTVQTTGATSTQVNTMTSFGYSVGGA